MSGLAWFQNSRVLFGFESAEADGIYCHPGEERLPLGTPMRRVTLERCGFGVQQLRNRLSQPISSRLLGRNRCRTESQLR